MSWSSIQLICLLPLVGLALAGGCQTTPKKKSNVPPGATTNPFIPSPQVKWDEQPLNVPPQTVSPVKEGPTPLVYMVESAAVVRVMDQNSGEDLLNVPVPGRTIISISDRTGISVGGTTMKLGPLPEGHRYAIYLESTQRNVYRSGTVTPGRPPMPATQPATQPGNTP